MQNAYTRKYLKIKYRNKKLINILSLKSIKNNFLNDIKYSHYLFITKYVFSPQVQVKFGISPSSKFLTNLVLHFSKCVNLVLLTNFC